MSTDQKEDRIYYWALYHLVAHWTVYIAFLVVLVGVGFELSRSAQSIKYPKVALFILVALWLGEVLIVYSNYRYGKFARTKLPKEELERFEIIPAKGSHWIMFGAATAITFADIWLVL